jgi:hypothetical protein
VGLVNGVTTSSDPSSGEFVIHVKGEYDYRFVSANTKDFIANMIKTLAKSRGIQCYRYSVVSRDSMRVVLFS